MRINEMFDLSGKVAIVTGGATGLGAQMAEALAESGANLVIAARKLERCIKACSELEKQNGIKAVPVACDISKPEDCKNLVDTAYEQFGRIDILVNNAGATWGADSMNYPRDRWQKVVDTNLTGTFNLSVEAAKKMKEQGGGKIVNIASLAGLVGCFPEVQDTVAYNATKGAIITLTKDLAAKWARFGIYVNSIAPGYFPTHMSTGLLEQNKELVLPRIPLQRFGGKDDIKGTVVFLSSAASDYITGHCIIVDGGLNIL